LGYITADISQYCNPLLIQYPVLTFFVRFVCTGLQQLLDVMFKVLSHDVLCLCKWCSV